MTKKYEAERKGASFDYAMRRARWKAAAGTYPQIRKRVLPLIVGTIGTHDVVDLAHSPTIAIGDAARIRAIVAKAIEAVRG